MKLAYKLEPLVVKTLPGINIQAPISKLIVTGQKVIETRTYEIPKNYLNKELFLVETPGKNGNFKAQAIAVIKFTSCFQYKNRSEFYSDFNRHQVTKESPWAWDTKPKWGWSVEVIESFSPITIHQRRGIVFTKELSLDCEN